MLAFGENVKERMAELTRDLPVGVDTASGRRPAARGEGSGRRVHQDADGSRRHRAGVSFLSLGWRPGIVVAIAIPLVLAITFVVMKLPGSRLQRISLGALIIALGLLVDDAMIAVEMMITKLEEGSDKIKAATFAYTSTAFPMLTGHAGHRSRASCPWLRAERRRRILLHAVRRGGIALLVSWIVAVLFTPLIGVKVLRRPTRSSTAGMGSRRRRAVPGLPSSRLRASIS